MVEDVHDLVGMQAGIDGVQHRSGAGHGVIELEVAVAVPGDRADPLARRDAETGERLRHAPGARGQVPERRAVNTTLDAPGDNLLFTVMPLGMHEQGRNQQR